jgi:outer membrane protein assembly factor BamB
MVTDDRASIDALDRFWDEVADGQPGIAADLDPVAAAVVRRFQRLPDVSTPRPGAVDRVWDRVAHPLDSHHANDFDQAPDVRPIARALPRTTTTRARLGPQRRWSTHLATAALVAVTLASAFLTFRGEQVRPGGAGNVSIPGAERAVSGTKDGVPMFRGNAAHTGVEPGPGPAGTPTIRWRLTVDGPLTEAVAIADGTIYANDGNALIAIDAADGVTRWQSRLGDSPLRGAPAVADGTVFVTDNVGTTFAVDARTGVGRWSRDGGVWQPDVTSGSPTVTDGTVIVFDEGVSGIDAATGADRWHSTLVCFGAPVVARGVLYVSCYDQGVHAIDVATGTELGHLDAYRIFLSLTVSEGMVYGQQLSGGVFAIDGMDGSERWQANTLQTSILSPLARAENRVFTVDGFDVLALDATTGSEVWRHQIAGGVTTAPVVAAGVIYVGTDDHGVYAIDAATGEERWHVTVAGPIVTEPAVVDGVVFVGDGTNTLYALGSANGS